jgi:hypothetical protein
MLQATENIVEKFGSEKIPSGWPKRLFIFSFLLALIMIGIYFGLVLGYGPYLDSQIQKKEAQIQQLTERIPIEQQREYIKFYSQLTNLKNLLDGHIISSKLFSLIEKNIHNNIYFNLLDLNIDERKLILDGVAKDYEALAIQLQAFKEVPGVTDSLLSEFRLVEGRIQFQIILSLSPSLFKL